jgi:hypothetical protein
MFLEKMKTYLLKPHMTVPTVTIASSRSKPVTLPPRQPLPRPIVSADKPALKLGLNVHLQRFVRRHCV